MATSQQAQLFNTNPEKKQGPVKCLGMTFENDTERRTYFIEQLKNKLADPIFRRIKAFPICDDSEILFFSDPPYFTLCPNPFLTELLSITDHDSSNLKYEIRQPYAGKLTAEERHPVYAYQPYHTKVPPDVIKRLIEYYTKPGDLVLDGFSGSGMTGVAARESGRRAILIDLCPIATFTSQVNCVSHYWEIALETMRQIITESKEKLGFLYFTKEKSQLLEVNYFVWSDVFTCPECIFEFPFFPHGVIHHGNKVETRKSFPCPNCGAELNVRRVERVITHDGKKRALVWVNAGSGRVRINREPTQYDMDLLQRVEDLKNNNWFPLDEIDSDGYSAKLAQLGDKAIDNVSKFLSSRNLVIFSDLWNRVHNLEDTKIRNLCFSTLTSIFTVISERQGYFGGGGGMSGNLYMPIVRMEKNIYDVLERKLGKLEEAEKSKQNLITKVFISTQSTTELTGIQDQTIDYIYTDPPFGANIIYSEMNLILESWFRIKTNNQAEAVIDPSRNRGFDDYASLMRSCFSEYFRVLKPGRWITIEFHNTQASVWNLIQTSIWESGFVISNIGFLDKGSTTILADIRPGAAKYDLIISAYKPDEELSKAFTLGKSDEQKVWEFVRDFLSRVPVFQKTEDGKAQIIPERKQQLLFDRVVAFHIQRGLSVPISMSEFLEGLKQRFPERMGMFFLPDQAGEWDKGYINTSGIEQLPLFATDESSAIQWIRQELEREPQSYQELHPKFMISTSGWIRHEKMLDLDELLRENFLVYEGEEIIPIQILNHMDSERVNITQHNGSPEIRQNAKGKWYVPDTNRAQDLEKLREKALIKEFDEYRSFSGKLIKVFRIEALRVGFKYAWERKDYKTIINVAEKIPEEILQEDPKLLMWYDQAITRSSGN